MRLCVIRVMATAPNARGSDHSPVPELNHEPINSSSLAQFVAGTRGKKGQLSPVRRFFCLFVTFDVLFTCLLWLICLVLGNHNLINDIKDEVVQYNIRTSLFDVIMLAVARSITLLLMYGLIHINHWWAVALTTLGTSAFLVSKVFFYDWDTAQANSTFGVFLLLCSFILAWGEVWLLDFRVIPREQQAMDVAARHGLNERAPLLGPYVASVAGLSSYYSPMPSPAGSEDEARLTSAYVEREGYRKKAKEAMTMACNELDSEGWQVECTRNSDTIYSKKGFKDKKIYKFVGKVLAPPNLVFQEIQLNLEDSPKWNHSFMCCKVLQTIDEKLDITYHVSSEGGAGLVCSRDFVNLRAWEKRGDDYISAGISVQHELMPPQKTYVRGENGPCAWIMECVPEEPNICTFHWLLHTDLKGWLPQYLIDQTLAGAMLDFMQHLRNHLSSLQSLRPSLS